ncbi:MAG: virulence protein [Saccharofermentanales bacterium]
MELKYNVAGSERKRMVVAIGKILEIDPVYKGTPSYAFKVGDYIIDRYGALIGSDAPETARLVHALAMEGFVAQQHEALTIELPRADFTDSALRNLTQLVESKSNLIRHALGAKDLTIEVTDEVIRFPWFAAHGEDTEAAAYTCFIAALFEMAKQNLRIKTQTKEVNNEKYAFRCFLLRLGFIGPEYKTERKILLRNLTGSSAFLSEESKLKAAFKRKAQRL